LEDGVEWTETPIERGWYWIAEKTSSGWKVLEWLLNFSPEGHTTWHQWYDSAGNRAGEEGRMYKKVSYPDPPRSDPPRSEQ